MAHPMTTRQDPPVSETAAAFLRRRAGDARLEDQRAILAPVPDRPPDLGDGMPPDP
jgi:hypothetical protein